MPNCTGGRAAIAAAQLLTLLFVAPAHGQPALPCTAPNRIDWPAQAPVWSLCWVAPNVSSGVDGSGLELRHVFYKGKRVFWRAHLPLLNVKYDPGGCGGSYLSYRDWANGLVRFEATNVIAPGYSEPTSAPRTVCDTPGADVGSFTGVAAEKLVDRLILTTQLSAGWYRYIMKWTFFLDGTVLPQFGFSAVTHPCTSKPHTHHAYWRFDFDVNGAADDAVQQASTPCWSTLPKELSLKRSAGPGACWIWRVLDKPTGLGYEIQPGPSDGIADTWAGADSWALRYHGAEIDDGGATTGALGDAQHLGQYENGEPIDGTDVVVWYHVSVRHDAGLMCETAGPTLKPIRPW